MLKALQIELLKMKRSKLLLLATFLPLLSILQGRMFAAQFKGEDADLWKMLYIGSMSQFSSLMFPIMIAVIIAIIARVEHHNDGWKQLFSLPVKRENVYLSKLVTAMLLIVYSALVFGVMFLVVGLSLNAPGEIPFDLVFGRSMLAIVAALPIIAIQFYISFRFSHIGVPLAVGIGLALPSMLIANSAKYWIYYPWTYPIYTSLVDMFEAGNKDDIMYVVCISTFVLINSVGLLQFRKKDIV
ncbi:ABC transporter permease [Pseudalkalibacillus sp. R45]|uniref:ABC transporter permease n=1 Tax=Pseudalkalibacillus sp. R45 TaxID=3457433 RepID=UPI003FCC7141